MSRLHSTLYIVWPCIMPFSSVVHQPYGMRDLQPLYSASHQKHIAPCENGETESRHVEPQCRSQHPLMHGRGQVCHRPPPLCESYGQSLGVPPSNTLFALFNVPDGPFYRCFVYRRVCSMVPSVSGEFSWKTYYHSRQRAVVVMVECYLQRGYVHLWNFPNMHMDCNPWKLWWLYLTVEYFRLRNEIFSIQGLEEHCLFRYVSVETMAAVKSQSVLIQYIKEAFSQVSAMTKRTAPLRKDGNRVPAMSGYSTGLCYPQPKNVDQHLVA